MMMNTGIGCKMIFIVMIVKVNKIYFYTSVHVIREYILIVGKGVMLSVEIAYKK